MFIFTLKDVIALGVVSLIILIYLGIWISILLKRRKEEAKDAK